MELEIKELFATADKDGNYLGISQKKKECEAWLVEPIDKNAVKVIKGFGLFSAETGIMPDFVADFHYTKEDAEHELAMV